MRRKDLGKHINVTLGVQMEAISTTKRYATFNLIINVTYVHKGIWLSKHLIGLVESIFKIIFIKRIFVLLILVAVLGMYMNFQICEMQKKKEKHTHKGNHTTQEITWFNNFLPFTKL